MKKRKSKVGSVYCIPIEDNLLAYAREISMGLFEFFDWFTNHKEITGIVTSKPVLFSSYVHKYVFTDSNWEKIEDVPVPVDYPMPLFFRQEIGNEEECYFVDIKGNMIQVSKEKCVGYERSAVWDYPHVESRLLDHYHHRENKWEKLLRVKL